MRTFTVPTNPYGDFRLYSHKDVIFNPGLTCLIGCNGSGKSTLMMLMKEELKNKPGVLVLSYDDRSNGGSHLMEKFGFNERYDKLGAMMMSSEGEKIHIGLEDFVSTMRRAIWQCEPDELWIFMDAVGSGLSIDGIREVKDFADCVYEDNEGKRDVYFVVSTNEFEFAEKTDCIDVTTFEHVLFTEYNTYRDFILKTRMKKDKRIERLQKKHASKT